MPERKCEECFIDIMALRKAVKESIEKDEKNMHKVKRLYKIKCTTALIIGLTVGISIGKVWMR